MGYLEHLKPGAKLIQKGKGKNKTEKSFSPIVSQKLQKAFMVSIANKAYPPTDPMNAGVTGAVAAETSVAPFCSNSKTWVHELCSIAAVQLKTCLELNQLDLKQNP